MGVLAVRLAEPAVELTAPVGQCRDDAFFESALGFAFALGLYERRPLGVGVAVFFQAITTVCAARTAATAVSPAEDVVALGKERSDVTSWS